MSLSRDSGVFGAALVSLLLLFSFVSVASAANPAPTVQSLANTPGATRLIVPNAINSQQYQASGCAATHNFSSATSLICPPGVNFTGAISDKAISLSDLGSDKQIGANAVWVQYTGSGVTIAVLDTGIDFTNHQLAAGTGPADPANGHCFAAASYDCGNGFFDDYGHGTHVAGIIMSAGLADASNGTFSKGVAPGARVWMGKVCNGFGSCYESDIAAGIQYVVNNHVASVISMSLGGWGTTSSNCDPDFLAQQINWAYAHGVVSVIAAGNFGWNMVATPGCASDAIAVAAVDSSDTPAYFTSFGAALQDHGVAAPGVGIYSTVPTGACRLCNSTGYAYLSGTSMATPHVAATVALMLQKHPGMSIDQIRSIIFNSANCENGKYGPCPNVYVGYGRVDARAAVAATPPTVQSPLFAGLPHPLTQSISQGYSARVTDYGISGGSGTYSSSWLEETPGATIFTQATDCVSSNVNGNVICTFSPTASTPLGTYRFKLRVSDGFNATNSIVASVTVASYQPLTVPQPFPSGEIVRPSVFGNLVDLGATGGDGSGIYSYQWLQQTPGTSGYVNATLCLPPTTTTTCWFLINHINATVPAGVYSFELRASDTSGTVTSAPAALIVLPEAVLLWTSPSFQVGGYNAAANSHQNNPYWTLFPDRLYGNMTTQDSWPAHFEQASWTWDFGRQYNGTFNMHWYANDSAGSCGAAHGTNATVSWFGSLDGAAWYKFAAYTLNAFGNLGSANFPITANQSGFFRFLRVNQSSDASHVACNLTTYVDSVYVLPSLTSPPTVTTTSSTTTTSTTSTISGTFSTKSLWVSNSPVAQGQVETLHVNVSVGTPPYTYNTWISNIITANIIFSSGLVNLSTSNTVAFTMPSEANVVGTLRFMARVTTSDVAPQTAIGINFFAATTSTSTSTTSTSTTSSSTSSTSTTSSSTTSTTSSTTTIPGCGYSQTIYLNSNAYCQQWIVQLASLGTPAPGGAIPAGVNIYFNGALTNSSSILPPNSVTYMVSGIQLWLDITQTSNGAMQYQKWALASLVTTSTSTSTTSTSSSSTSTSTSTTTTCPRSYATCGDGITVCGAGNLCGGVNYQGCCACGVGAYGCKTNNVCVC